MKKRLIAMLLAVLMVLSLAGCGGNRADEVEGLGAYDDLIQIADENRAPYVASNVEETMNIDQYAISDKKLLTQEEIDALRTERGRAKKVSVVQALEDVDLFFRAWKYSYPSYYYIGEDLFLNAHEQAIAAVSKYEEDLSAAQLGNILYDSMSFLQDYHSSINGIVPAHAEDDLRYLSYTDAKQPFDKDENGYYQTYEDVKWYFSSCSNADMRLEPALLSTGKVAYCPMMVIPEAQGTETDTIVLKNGEDERKIKLRWIVSEDEQGNELPQQYKTSAKDDIFYIDYLTMRADIGDVNEFIQMAEEAKQYKTVIFDLRHTQGHEHWQIIEWIKLFTGETPEVAAAFFVKNNALRNLQNFPRFKEVSLGNEECVTWYVDGRKVPNTIPLIVLTDKSSASSVEEAVNYLRTVENSIVIGGNTAGCAQGGSVQTYYLPHSGVKFAIGGFMQFEGEAKNIDGIGYEPDIWCNPADAKALALKFIEYYGLKELKLETAEVNDEGNSTDEPDGLLSNTEISALVAEGNIEEIYSKITVAEDCVRLISASGIRNGDNNSIEDAFAKKVLRAEQIVEMACHILAGDYEEVGVVTMLPDNYYFLYVKNEDNFLLCDVLGYSGGIVSEPFESKGAMLACAIDMRGASDATTKAWPW